MQAISNIAVQKRQSEYVVLLTRKEKAGTTNWKNERTSIGLTEQIKIRDGEYNQPIGEGKIEMVNITQVLVVRNPLSLALSQLHKTNHAT